MKKYLLLTALLIALTTFSYAQTNVYHPFPDSNAVWGMSSGCVDMVNQCGNYMYVKLYYAGDTIIDGYSYKMIYQGVGPQTNSSCCGISSPGYGFLRQDTAARKVYWRDQWMSSDTLLYDFTLNVGDTLIGFLNCDTSPPLTVNSVDSILVGASYRKRINFKSTDVCADYFSIIEGIGGTTGLGIPLCTAPFQNGTMLECFTVNGNLIYTSSPPCSLDTIPCGTSLVGFDDSWYNQPKKKLSIFPNPSIENIILECQEIYLPLHVSVCNMLGRKLLEKEINTEHSEIDISSFSKGIYFLRAENRKAILTFEKIVKQ